MQTDTFFSFTLDMSKALQAQDSSSKPYLTSFPTIVLLGRYLSIEIEDVGFDIRLTKRWRNDEELQDTPKTGAFAAEL